MLDITPEKAEIIGLLCAEGSFHDYTSTFMEYYKDRKKSYLKKNKRSIYIQFANFDEKLLLHFKDLINKVYGYDVPINKDRVRICRRSLIDDLLKYTDYGHLKWEIPNSVKKGSKDIKIKFIRGFFDGDGTISTTVRMFSTNELSLRGISDLLKEIGIKNNFNGPCIRESRKPYFYIYILRSEQSKFLNMIDPRSKK